MSQPFFSIVIPTYNRAGFIVKTINTVLAQNFSDLEVIVVDDGSTDNTSEVIKGVTDSRVKYVKKENGERAAARNAGTRIANGKFINFVDSDDLLYPMHTEEAHKIISENPSIKVFHLGFDVREVNGKFIRDSRHVNNVNRQLLSGNILGVEGVFIERAVALANPFNEDRALSAIEDWELWLRLAAKFTILHVPVITSTVVQHEERSVMSVDIPKIKTKMEAFLQAITNNREIVQAFGERVDRIVASAHTYTALHVAISKGRRSDIFSFTLRGLMKNPREMFSKRFLVILKLFVLR